jgi:hypothetical protein
MTLQDIFGQISGKSNNRISGEPEYRMSDRIFDSILKKKNNMNRKKELDILSVSLSNLYAQNFPAMKELKIVLIFKR